MNATKTTVVGYTTQGSLRGQCGHLHGTDDEAMACLGRDQDGCMRQSGGGYSDRRIVEVGSDGYLYFSVAEDRWVPRGGGPSNGAAKFRPGN